ncbi:MAG: hypothetical protein DMG68_08840 [Acidobacteria bacterium]|jgi:hypothetical protein|nr:MAG: hypothetical protein DMG68_08840 [Acidobacteriota bacterium]
MPDPLYLSLWFPHFETIEILPRAVSLMRQFPFSPARPGITYLALHPVDWGEATVLEQRFNPGITPEEAAGIASDLLHDDYAYIFEAHWDLWTPGQGQQRWALQPNQVKFLVHGKSFQRAGPEVGDIEIDFGLDAPFLYEEMDLHSEDEKRLKENVQKLVAFTAIAEKATGASGRLLRSESEENLAQKLISRLQRVQ